MQNTKVKMIGAALALLFISSACNHQGASLCGEASCEVKIPVYRNWQEGEICHLDSLTDELALQLMDHPLNERVEEAGQIRKLDLKVRDLKHAFQKRWDSPPSCGGQK